MSVPPNQATHHPSGHSVQKYPADAIIFKDGDARRFLYIVQKGRIAIYKVSAAGERLPLGIIGSGEYLAETGLLDGKLTHATWAVALTDVEVIAIPSELILEQLKHAPAWLVSLTRGLSQKLRQMNELIRRNRVADESLDSTMLNIQENDRKNKS